jgi:hypothetical protein
MRTSSAARQFVTWAPLAAVLIVLLPAVSVAQEPVNSFDQLDTRLKVRDTVSGTDRAGRKVKGKLTDLSASSVTVATEGMKDGDSPSRFEIRDITLIQRHDSMLNGVLIGFAAGFVGTLVGSKVGGTDCDADTCDEVIGYSFLFGGIGAAAGLAIDGLRGPKTVYLASIAGTHVSLQPLLSRRIKGVAVAYSF